MRSINEDPPTINNAERLNTIEDGNKSRPRWLRRKIGAIALTVGVIFGANVATGNFDRQPVIAQNQENNSVETSGRVEIGEPLTVVNRELSRALPDVKAEIVLSDDYERSSVISQVFENPQAEQARRELGIHATDYFILSSEVTDKLAANSEWANEEKLLPIFVPAIYRYQDQIESASKEFGVPSNFIAQIMQAESRGYERAHSSKNAYGLMQIVPKYHLQRFVEFGYLPTDASYQDYLRAIDEESTSKYDEQVYLKALYNPEAQIRASAQFLAELVAQSRRHFSDLPPNSPVIYAKAAMAYNGGGSLIAKESGIPDESANYAVETERMILDASVASALRHKYNMTDEQIYNALRPSQEMSDLIFSVRSLHLNDSTKALVRRAGYREIIDYINGKQSPAVDYAYKLLESGNGILRSYRRKGETYKGSAFDVGYSPTLMLNLQMAGLGLYFKAGNGELTPFWGNNPSES